LSGGCYITVPTKTGYTFGGYYTGTNGSGTPYVNASGMCIGNMYTTIGDKELYAQWTAITYTISYDLDGGSLASGVTNPTSYTIETATFNLNNPTKTGYTFAGWTGTDLSGATTTVTIAQGSTGNRSYTATWTQNNYTITIDPAGTNTNPGHWSLNGSGTTKIAPHNITGKHYGDVDTTTLKNEPLRAGYIFTGWKKTSGTGTFEPFYTGSGDVETTVNSEAAGDYTSIVFKSGKTTARLVDFIASGTNTYEITAWVRVTGGSVTFINGADSETTAKVTLSANSGWQKIVLKKAHTSGASGNPGFRVTGDSSSAFDIKNVVIKNITAGTVVNPRNRFTVGDGNMTITACWEKRTYSIDYDLDGGTVATANPSTYTIESSAITLNNPTKPGYTFAGWQKQYVLEAYNYTNEAFALTDTAPDYTYGFLTATAGDANSAPFMNTAASYRTALYAESLYMAAGETYTANCTRPGNLGWRRYNKATGAYTSTGAQNTFTMPTNADNYVVLVHTTGYDADMTVTRGGNPKTTEIIPAASTGDVKFIAIWTATTINIVFRDTDNNELYKMNNATAQSVQIQDLANQATNASLSTIYSYAGYPEKQNAIFKGWYKDAACTTPYGASSDTITSADYANSADGRTVTMYAGWRTIQNNIELNPKDPAYQSAPVERTGDDGKVVVTPITNQSEFEMYGVQVRVTGVEYENGDIIDHSNNGMRFCIRVSNDLLNDLKGLNTANNNLGHEMYGFTYISKTILDRYNQLENHYPMLVAENIAGTNVTLPLGNSKYRHYSERNFMDNSTYKVYTCVITGYDSSDTATFRTKMETDIAVRPFIEYYDVNGVLRTYYNTDPYCNSNDASQVAKTKGGAYFTSLKKVSEHIFVQDRASNTVKSRIFDLYLKPYYQQGGTCGISGKSQASSYLADWQTLYGYLHS
ncbi:MAG: InlB B-repeat-containing protein, partial [Clostridiales bacterium]|nr:InlB B-repeat-containing protein [Clostridiales bacterium]